MDEWDEANLFDRLGGRETGFIEWIGIWRNMGHSWRFMWWIGKRLPNLCKISLVVNSSTRKGFPTEETLQDIVFELYDLMRALVHFQRFEKALDGFKFCKYLAGWLKMMFFLWCFKIRNFWSFVRWCSMISLESLDRFVSNKQIDQNNPQTLPNAKIWAAHTPPKINMEPEHEVWKKVFLFQGCIFSGSMLIFPGCIRLVTFSKRGVDSLLGPQFDRFAKTDGTFHRLKVRTVDWLEWSFDRFKKWHGFEDTLVSSEKRKLQGFWKKAILWE